MLRILTRANWLMIALNVALILWLFSRKEPIMSTSTNQQPRVIGEADYKGKRYAVLFRARNSKFGDRTKLAFKDLTKEFWVDTSALSNCELFPVAVDAADYQPDARPGRGAMVDQPSAENEYGEAIDQSADDTPSYCAHCGQRIPSTSDDEIPY